MTSASEELLKYCLAGEEWPDSLLRAALAEQEGRALLRIVVERLGDLFEPALCDTYARLFTRVIEMIRPEFSAGELNDRYWRVRQPRVCSHEPGVVYVLSRVTLGADVAVTSIVLDAAKRRFPRAAIMLVGARKNHEVFAADSRIQLYEFLYPSGAGLAARIAAVPNLRTPRSIVIDPDSRLSQLGLLPVCDDRDYFFFESRAYGGNGDESLGELTRRWVAETFSISDASAYIAPAANASPAKMNPAEIAVSFGVGGNQEKRLPDPFERELTRLLVGTGMTIAIDEGAGAEERDRVRALAEQFPSVRTWSGAYAPFAHLISQARMYIGYDSAGQHVAAATGVPLISIWAGYPSERMFSRWRPTGKGPMKIIKTRGVAPSDVLEQAASAVQNLTL
jgi:ADP-heptose:LPS heptosyltransferase